MHLLVYTTHGVYTTAGALSHEDFRMFGILAVILSLMASIVSMAWGTVERNWSSLNFDGAWTLACDKVSYNIYYL